MTLKKINSLLHIDVGAPTPTIISDEHTLNILYYYEKNAEYNLENYTLPKERDIKNDTGIAILTFQHVVIHKFGYPNDEMLTSHPYYPLGLTSYGMFEVEGSDWINTIENANRVHPFHKPSRYRVLKHYIISFKDSTFECIAEKVELIFTTKTLSEALNHICIFFT